MNIRRPTGVELRAWDRHDEPAPRIFGVSRRPSVRRYLALALLAGGLVYFALTANMHSLFVAGGILAGSVGLLITFGIYIQNNVHGS